MKKHLVLLLFPLLLSAITYRSEIVKQSWKFDSAEVLDLLDPVSGKWGINAPPKLNQSVLTQGVKYADFPKVLLKNHDFFDFDVVTKIYISSENQDTQAGGLILRYRNLYSFYMLFLNAKEKRMTLTKASLGGMKVVKRVNHEFAPDRWYELKANCYLDRVKAFVDGQLILEAKDDTSTGGKIGLVTAGTSQVYFQDLNVSSEILQAAK